MWLHPEHVQRFVLFTNYQFYVDEFVRWGLAQLAEPDSGYDSLCCPGVVITRDTPDPDRAVAASS